MASLKRAKGMFAKAGKLAAKAQWLDVARLELGAFMNAHQSSANGASAFAYRMRNACECSARIVLGDANATHAEKSEAGRIVAQLDYYMPAEKA